MEGVFQYQCSFGNRSVKLNTRYVPSVTHYPAWVDSMHSFYLGLNCYLCPEAVNAVKLMLAVEYVTSRGGLNNGQGLQRMVCFRGRPVQVLIPSCRYCSFLSTVGW